MKIVKGNKTIELNSAEFKSFIAEFPYIHIDLGTGDGRFVYENALKDRAGLYIGIDPAEKQLKEYSIKAVKKKLENALFVVASVELLPKEFGSVADKVSIILPWGSLLEKIANPEEVWARNITDMLKPDGELELLFGYAPNLEPSEVERLNLPFLSLELVKDQIIPSFTRLGGMKLQEFRELLKEQLKSYPTSWAKKLTYGRDRVIYSLLFKRSL